jgi:hypothetical protein
MSSLQIWEIEKGWENRKWESGIMRRNRGNRVKEKRKEKG